MPQPTAAQIAVAALTFELAADGSTAPTEAHLLPPGPFRAVDGRPFECPGWQLDAAIASALVSLAAARKNDILIDFEHQSLRSQENGKRVEAAGWIPRTLEWREGKGLYATNINWVGDTAQLIKEKKVRYISAIFVYDSGTGAVLEILSVGLTNTPALDGLEALAALARTHYIDSKEEADMPGTTEKLAALTQERDGLKTNVAALTQERDGLTTQVAALTQERDALKAKEAAAAAEKEKADHAAMLQAALNDGRLAPAQKAWAEKLSLAALTECLATLTPIAMLTKQTTGLDPAAGNTHGLTDVELAACARMRVSPEDFKKTKAS